MEMNIVFPEKSVNGHKVHAVVNEYVIKTDQPVSYGADNSAPSPFLTFLGAIGTCSGWFLLRFLEARNLPLDGVLVTMTTKMDPDTHLIPEVKFTVTLPAEFPEKYRKPMIAAMHQCAVTRHLQHPPKFVTDVVVDGETVLSKSFK